MSLSVGMTGTDELNQPMREPMKDVDFNLLVACMAFIQVLPPSWAIWIGIVALAVAVVSPRKGQ